MFQAGSALYFRIIVCSERVCVGLVLGSTIFLLSSFYFIYGEYIVFDIIKEWGCRFNE